MLKKCVYALLGASLVLCGGLILVPDNASAQNISVTDYQVPVSAADRLLIDFSMNHATTAVSYTHLTLPTILLV